MCGHPVVRAAPRIATVVDTFEPVTSTRLCIVSDTHLSPAAPEADANWDAVVGYVEDAACDVVIHVGDLSFDGAHDVEDLRHARRQLDRLPVPWHAVPGNHDVGDNPWAGSPDNSTVDGDRTRRWLDVVGADHWSLQLDGWRVLAINAQLFGSGLPDEARQWSWLHAQLDDHGAAGATALITHKPLTASAAELAAAPPYRFVPDAARHRLVSLVRDRNVTLVVSGHVHQYRRLDVDGVAHVWAPTTWAVLPDEIQPTLGTKRCGVVTLHIADDHPFDPEMVEPDGLTQYMLAPDIPVPYPQ